MAKRENWSKWSSRKFRLHRVGGFEFIHEHIMNVYKPLQNKENQLKYWQWAGAKADCLSSQCIHLFLKPTKKYSHFTWGRQPVNLEGSDVQNPEAPQWWFFLCAALQPEHHPASPTSLSALPMCCSSSLTSFLVRGVGVTILDVVCSLLGRMPGSQFWTYGQCWTASSPFMLLILPQLDPKAIRPDNVAWGHVDTI